ncbi:HD domain-containing phosphohydrolase [Sulfurimonas sp.]|uniref:HD domain-containing phosphohydrolase n=1 Tax=Sulfurimonas sp. TaxID=2022749 RepID=UPI0039EE6269
MFEKHRCNMKPTESYLRIILATLILFFSVINNSIFLALFSLLIYYTGFKKFCFIYYIFKINEKFSVENYYLSLLPKHRPSPVFIFDINGNIVFQNQTAKKELPNINSISDMCIKEYEKIISKNTLENSMFKYEEKFYKIDLKGISREKFVLAYLTDVTEIMELNDAIEDTQKEVIYAMGEIGETRSKETGNHVKRVALYSKELALLYGLSYEEASKLEMASPMHDIGKVGIPDAILNAPRKLTKDEFQIMKTHASMGYDMLKSSNKPILQAAAIVANEHHEKYDGSGYPNGTSQENIHIYGRITAIADVFDALGSHRVYKKAWELDKILELFKDESGKHFDPKLVKLFLDNLDIFLKIRDKFKDL